MTELPVWTLTQRRSQPGGSKWCAFVLDGSDHRLDAARPLLPVLRPFRWTTFSAGDGYEAPEPDHPVHENWWINGPRIWRGLWQAGLLMTAREHTGPMDGGSVGPYFGVFEIEDAELSAERLRIVAGKKIAEVAT